MANDFSSEGTDLKTQEKNVTQATSAFSIPFYVAVINHFMNSHTLGGIRHRSVNVVLGFCVANQGIRDGKAVKQNRRWKRGKRGN